jgi:hypothetical protein
MPLQNGRVTFDHFAFFLRGEPSFLMASALSKLGRPLHLNTGTTEGQVIHDTAHPKVLNANATGLCRAADFPLFQHI